MLIAVYGKEVSRFKDANEDYPIMLRYNKSQRNNIEELQNLRITYRDMNMGGAYAKYLCLYLPKLNMPTHMGELKEKIKKE
jgi:hypothetical protein